ncbi:unnamed protein product [Boreogadus saida]
MTFKEPTKPLCDSSRFLLCAARYASLFYLKSRKRTAGPAHLQVCLCNTAPSCLGALRGRQAHGQSMDEAGQRMRALEDGVGERREGYRGRRTANVTDIL